MSAPASRSARRWSSGRSWRGGFPNTPFYREFRAVALLARGELLLAKNDTASAGKELEAARDLLEKLATGNARKPSYRADLGRVYAAMGRHAERGGEAARAAGWYRRAAEELRGALEAAPENAFDRKALEEAERAAKRLGGCPVTAGAACLTTSVGLP